MVLKNLSILVLWTKVALALEWLKGEEKSWLFHLINVAFKNFGEIPYVLMSYISAKSMSN